MQTFLANFPRSTTSFLAKFSLILLQPLCPHCLQQDTLVSLQ